MGADPRAEAQKYAARVDFQAICYKLSAAMLESRPEGETHMRTAYSTANTTAASPVHLSFFLPGTPYFPFFSSAPHNLFSGKAKSCASLEETPLCCRSGVFIAFRSQASDTLSHPSSQAKP